MFRTGGLETNMREEAEYRLRSGSKEAKPQLSAVVGRTLLLLAALLASATGHCDPGQDKLMKLFGQDKEPPKETLTTLAHAKKIDMPSVVDGVTFDVPLTYFFRGYSVKDGGWFAVQEGKTEVIDFITIYGLMPDLAPLSEENLAEFEKLGWGKQVTASLTHRRSWDYFFKNSFNEDYERRPDTPRLPGMLHYYLVWGKADTYLSRAYATDDLTMITCNDQSIHHDASPSCGVQTSYVPAPELLVAQHLDKAAIFYLEYHFSSQYLSQWRDIDKKLKALFDQFIRNAGQRMAAHP